MTTDRSSLLASQRVLVAGGTGDVGEGVVRQLLASGTTAVVPARSAEALQRLRLTVPEAGLDAFESPFSTAAQAESMVDQAIADGPLDAFVALIGGWWHGEALATVAADEWDSVIASNLTPHFAVARAAIPKLKREGAFVQILGGAADQPIPGSGLISVVSAAVAMLGRVLRAEAEGEPRILQVVIRTPVISRSRPTGEADWLSADDVGRVVAALIAGSLVSEGGVCDLLGNAHAQTLLMAA